MNEEATRKWFEMLVTERPERMPGPPVYYDDRAVLMWIAEAETSLRSVFPPKAAVLVRWEQAVHAYDNRPPFDREPHPVTLVERVYANFDAAKKLVDEGRLSTLIDGVRLETVTEVLEQAEVLSRSGALVAATVLAGGALETHLQHLCSRHGLSISGTPGISAYDQAIAGARKAGNEIYTLGDSKQVIAWGDRRNKAAHEPLQFKDDQRVVTLMIDGVRQFILRTP